jgi:outer membrane protein OmpA-like peptidoglycan-associated protein
MIKIVVLLMFVGLSSKIIANNEIPFGLYREMVTKQKNFEPKGKIKILIRDSEGTFFRDKVGRYWNYEYKLDSIRKKPFILDVKESIADKNGTILFQGQDYLFFKLYNKRELYWGRVVYYKDKYNIEMVQEKSIEEATKNIHLKITFDTSRATIKIGALGEIDRIVDFMNKNPTLIVEIQGHTDSAGDAQANLNLSQKRAESVKSAVIEKGIDTQRITAIGYGEVVPIADNSTTEGRRENRRVELKILSH